MTDPKTQAARDSLWLRVASEWNRWTGASVNRSIFGAAVTIGVLSVGVKLISAIKEIFIAHAFGTNDALDAFLMAYLLPFFAINVISGSFNAALIPTFVRVRDRDGHSAAQALLSSMLCWSLVLLAGVTLLLGITANSVLPVLAGNFSPAKLALTRELFYLLLPTLLICGLSTTWSAVLNAGQKFALASITPIVTPLLIIGGICAAGTTKGIFPVVFATVAGLAVEASVLGWGLRRLGFSLFPRRRGVDPAVKEVLGQYVPIAAGAVLMSGSSVINQSMAATLGPGSVSGWNYGTRVVSFILSIGAVALGTAVLPYFSRMVAAADWSGARHTLRTCFRLLTIFSVPLTVVLIVGSEWFVQILFERGNFTRADTRFVAPIAAFFALQIPFYLAGQIGVRLLNALGKGRSIMVICAVNLAANLAGNILLMEQTGVAGIALATSLVYLLSCLQIFFAVARELKRRERGRG